MTERPDLPLFAWDAQGRAPSLHHTRRRRLATTGLGFGVGLVLVLGSAFDPPRPRLVWNASASAPVGLYRVLPDAPVVRGDMVIARVPVALRRLAAQRHYLPANVPLVKRVVAVAGDRVCGSGRRVSVNGRTVAERRPRDGAGRPMPSWNGCLALGPGMVFLLMTTAPDSFDGRYFGVTLPGDVIGKAIPLWVR